MANRKESLSVVAERLAAALLDPGLTPAGMAANALRWAARQKFEGTHEEDAMAISVGFAETVNKLLMTDDTHEVLRQIVIFKRNIREQSSGGPAQRSELERLTKWLRDAGYNGSEIEAIGLILKPGEKIGPFDSHEIQIGDRIWGREELRQAMRPRTFTNDESWNRQFPPIPAEGGQRFNVN